MAEGRMESVMGDSSAAALQSVKAEVMEAVSDLDSDGDDEIDDSEFVDAEEGELAEVEGTLEAGDYMDGAGAIAAALDGGYESWWGAQDGYEGEDEVVLPAPAGSAPKEDVSAILEEVAAPSAVPTSSSRSLSAILAARELLQSESDAREGEEEGEEESDPAIDQASAALPQARSLPAYLSVLQEAFPLVAATGKRLVRFVRDTSKPPIARVVQEEGSEGKRDIGSTGKEGLVGGDLEEMEWRRVASDRYMVSGEEVSGFLRRVGVSGPGQVLARVAKSVILQDPGLTPRLARGIAGHVLRACLRAGPFQRNEDEDEGGELVELPLHSDTAAAAAYRVATALSTSPGLVRVSSVGEGPGGDHLAARPLPPPRIVIQPLLRDRGIQLRVTRVLLAQTLDYDDEADEEEEEEEEEEGEKGASEGKEEKGKGEKGGDGDGDGDGEKVVVEWPKGAVVAVLATSVREVRYSLAMDGRAVLARVQERPRWIELRAVFPQDSVSTIANVFKSCEAPTSSPSHTPPSASSSASATTPASTIPSPRMRGGDGGRGEAGSFDVAEFVDRQERLRRLDGIGAGSVVGGEAPLMHGPVMAWGAGRWGNLGNGHFASRPYPSMIAFGPELGIPRVSKVSCGPFHCIALTDAGLVFSWGTSPEGALGLGDIRATPTPRIVPLFGLEEPLTAVDVAAGGDSVGGHSLVVAYGKTSNDKKYGVATEEDEGEDGERENEGKDGEEEGDGEEEKRRRVVKARTEKDLRGRVYACGLGSALGIASPTSRTTMTVVSDPVLNDPRSGGVVRVAAGGGFSLALTAVGEVFSWGKWANGRLGRGPPPGVRRGPRQSDGSSATVVPRHSLIPGRVRIPSQAAPIRSIATGESHALAADADGGVWAWGAGSAGQLGTGETFDRPDPVRVPLLQSLSATPSSSSSSSSKLSPVIVVRVACGQKHSLAIGVDGSLWSWGGDGGPQLGLADPELPPSLRPSTMEEEDAKEMSASSSFDPTSSPPNPSSPSSTSRRLRRPWLWPRRLPAFPGASAGGQRVVCAAGGRRHTVAVSETGEVYVWGSAESGALGLFPGPSAALAAAHSSQSPLPSTTSATLFDAAAEVASALRAFATGSDQEDVAVETLASLWPSTVRHAIPTFPTHRLLPGRDLRRAMRAQLSPVLITDISAAMRVDDAELISSIAPPAIKEEEEEEEGEEEEEEEEEEGVEEEERVDHVMEEVEKGVGIDEIDVKMIGMKRSEVDLTPLDGVYRKVMMGVDAYEDDDVDDDDDVEGKEDKEEGDDREEEGLVGWKGDRIGKGVDPVGEYGNAAPMDGPDVMWGEIGASVACGPSFTVVVTGGSRLGWDIGTALPYSLTPAGAGGARSEFEEAAAHVFAEACGDDRVAPFSPVPRPTSVQGQVGGADCLLIAGDATFPCHRAILAMRSSKLRELLLSSSFHSQDATVASGTSDSLLPSSLPSLPLPDLSSSTLAALLEFIYTDNLSRPLSPLSEHLTDVLAAARRYRLPRLEALCRLLLASPYGAALRGLRRRGKIDADGSMPTMDGSGETEASATSTATFPDFDDDDALEEALAAAEAAAEAALNERYGDESYEAYGEAGEMEDEEEDGVGDEVRHRPQHREKTTKSSAPSLQRALEAAAVQSLGRDLARGLADGAYADTILIAGEKRFLAHRVILACRSEYFRRLFLPQAMEDGRGGKESVSSFGEGAPPPPRPGEVVEVELPDAPETVARLLFFCYSDSLLPSSSPSALFRDVVVADRYALPRMRSLAESLLPLNTANAARALELADAIGATTLRARALAFVVRRAGRVALTPTFTAMRRRAPSIAAEVFMRVRHRDDAYHGQLAKAQDIANRAAKAREKRQEIADKETKQPIFAQIPFIEIGLFFILLTMYLFIHRYTTLIGPAVPIINVVTILIILLLTCRSTFFQ